MSSALIKIITVGVVVAGSLAARWQRDSVIVRICPREILFLESVEERYRAHGRGLNAFLKHWRTWITFALYSAALACAALALSELAKTVTQGGQWSLAGARLAVLLPVICEMLLIPIMVVRFRRWMRVYLREYLNDHGIPVCRNCGYDLRGHISGTCSECGTAFDGKDAADDESQ